jgi:phage shock protein C
MEPSRRLYRSRKNRKVAGVCGGLAEYLNTDPTVIRVLFIVLTVMGGAGGVIYLAMWLIVPEEP